MENEFAENEARLAVFRQEITVMRDRIKGAEFASGNLDLVKIEDLGIGDLMQWEKLKAILLLIDNDFLAKKDEYDKKVQELIHMLGPVLSTDGGVDSHMAFRGWLGNILTALVMYPDLVESNDPNDENLVELKNIRAGLLGK